VLRVLSEICVRQTQYERGAEYLQAIIAMESQTSLDGDPNVQRLISLAYEDLGEMLISQGEYDTAQHYIEIAIRRWVERGETLRQAISQNYLGTIALKRKEYDRAYQIFTAVLLEAKQAKNQTLITVFATHLATTAMHLGDYALARTVFREALQIAVQIDRKVSIVLIAERLSLLAILQAQNEVAAQLWGFASAMRDRLQTPVTPHNQADYAEQRQTLVDRLGGAFERNYDTGCSLGLATFVQLASAVVESSHN
jgi:tetratricopeptide (TPR) repeat protein